jgi:hypothetical protein
MKSARVTPALEALSPGRAGHRPQTSFCAVVAVALVSVGGCANNDANQVTAPTVLGMTPSVAPAYDDGETQMYEVQIPVTLPIRRPLDIELKDLPETPPYPRMPYLKASDVRVEVRYTLTNLDDQPHDVQLLIDPWNEFVRYKPGIVVSDEMTQPNLSGYDRQFRIGPKSRLLGTLTSDDLTELAVDLATVENILKTPPSDPQANVSGIINRVFNIQNRSNVYDPIVSPYIPSVIAGITGFDLGLRVVSGQGDPGKPTVGIAVEVTVDLTDLNGNRVLATGAPADQQIEMPDQAISPPGAQMIN